MVFLKLEPSLGILLKLSLCKFYHFSHPQVVWPTYCVQQIVLGDQINCFPLHIKFKVRGSSIMVFPDWVQVKEKTQYILVLKVTKFREDWLNRF